MIILYINSLCTLNEFDIIIYNDENKIIYDGKTINNKLNFNFEINNLYKIKISNYYYGVHKLIPYYCQNKNEKICYNIIIPYNIMVQLFDQYYQNMPIEKGNIIMNKK